MEYNLSSLDIHFLIPELKSLIGAKIEKIFQTKEDFNILFALHISGEGKKFLYTSIPDVICITDFKPDFPDLPPSFCSSLRRKITNAKIKEINQINFERIIKIDLSTKHGDAILYIELFSTGNIILTDGENQILAVAKSQTWGKRTLKNREEYKLPPQQINLLEISQQEFNKNITSSDKESIVKSLAIDFSLGGVFSEEVLMNLDLDKNKSPSQITPEESEKIYNQIKNLINSPVKPNKVGNKIYPIEMKSLIPEEFFETFNQGINKIVFQNYKKTEKAKIEVEKKESLSKISKILNAQKNQLQGLEQSKEENTEKGELIYKNYSQIKEILEYIQKNKKIKSWNEIKKELEKNDLFVSLDEHTGKLELNLE